MQKIVSNQCFGGFGLSHEAIMLYAKYKGIKLYFWDNSNLFTTYCLRPKEEHDRYLELWHKSSLENRAKMNCANAGGHFSDSEIKRDDLTLISVITDLGEKANADHAKLEIFEIPNSVKWHITEYDGYETIREDHRSW